MIKTLSIAGILWCAAILSAQEQVAPLEDGVKQDLIETLKAARGDASVSKTERIKKAMTALAPLASNEAAAMTLFEKCYKKVNYDDNRGRNDRDWREWRAANREKFTSSANRKMICYQIRWTLICLNAAMVPEDELDTQEYLADATSLITDMVKDTDSMVGSEQPFNGSIIEGPIGMVYGITGYQPAAWPANVMNIARIIDVILLKKAREEADFKTLRKGWDYVIAATRKVHTDMKEAAAKEAKKAARQAPPEGKRELARITDKIIKEDAELITDALELTKEMDCYFAGDQLNAVRNMMRIIGRTKDPKRREMFIEAVRSLLERGHVDSIVTP